MADQKQCPFSIPTCRAECELRMGEDCAIKVIAVTLMDKDKKKEGKK